jgi:hypothetical protein
MISIQEKVKGYEGEVFISSHIPAGVQMTFANGNTISIQFGYGNYCENRHRSKSECRDAEIAIWNDNDEWYNFGSDTVKGWCNMDEVAYWIHFAANNTF